jgi:hypothetical protein
MCSVGSRICCTYLYTPTTWQNSKSEKEVQVDGGWVSWVGILHWVFKGRKAIHPSWELGFQSLPWELILFGFLPPSHNNISQVSLSQNKTPHWFVPLPYGDSLWLLYLWLELIGSSLFVVPSFSPPPPFAGCFV